MYACNHIQVKCKTIVLSFVSKNFPNISSLGIYLSNKPIQAFIFQKEFGEANKIKTQYNKRSFEIINITEAMVKLTFIHQLPHANSINIPAKSSLVKK